MAIPLSWGKDDNYHHILYAEWWMTTKVIVVVGVKLRFLIWCIPVMTFIAGTFFYPLISRQAERLDDWLYADDKKVVIDGCAPLVDARILIKRETATGDKIIADEPVEAMNLTSLLFKNELGRTIKDVTITIYPVGRGKNTPDLLFSEMFSTSIKGSESYQVQREDGHFELTLPVFHDADAVLIYNAFAGPLNYILEIYSHDYSTKGTIGSNCPPGVLFEGIIPTKFFNYNSKRCQLDDGSAGPCRIELSVPFKITEEMKGENVFVEHIIIPPEVQNAEVGQPKE